MVNLKIYFFGWVKDRFMIRNWGVLTVFIFDGVSHLNDSIKVYCGNFVINFE